MIYARPGHDFTALLEGAPTGMVGTLRVKLLKTDGTDATAWSTAGIIEIGSTGNYIAVRTAPAVEQPTDFILLWNKDPVNVTEDVHVAWEPPGAETDPLNISWRPSLAEVAALLRTRTKDNMGTELGTFTADTRPTAAEVEQLTSLATAHVASRVGLEPCRTALESRARGLAALYTAMLIELSYFPEQVGTDVSPYNQYRDLFDDGIKALITDVAETCGGVPEAGESGALPVFDFTQPVTPLGKGTVW